MRTLVFWAMYLLFNETAQNAPTALVVITFMLVIFLDVMYMATKPLFPKR